ncbi:tetratricopeptide (TPR) repeat protein [Sinomonas atrocyanea]|uniref:tetratricopeptide repeat protein n=1 Tax=Sinomonas atrocyanea TaxID=37927 RepID=UPI00278223C1|nr:tetratricopeptide repeat protein [Sinomonas atrocyanea]MDP9883955.1 tetratricopeptide (TPR) repeat protein [Sinomonas atrocyanea]
MISDRREWPDAGFPGVAVNPETLDTEVVDEERCADALAASSDPRDHALVELARGHVSAAAEILVEARYADPESFRLKVLELDVLRAGNRNDRAVERAQQLLSESKGTPNEAMVLQYLGKIQFSRGNYAAAEKAFSQALDLRVAASADASLIYSSTVALGRARELRSREQ